LKGVKIVLLPNVSSAPPRRCNDCNTHLTLQVLQSAAGYYIGTACKCGPYSRESSCYYPTRQLAQADLDDRSYPRRI